MVVTVFGAAGRTGQHVLTELLAAKHHVRAFVRDPAKIPLDEELLQPVQGDLANYEDVQRAVVASSAVICVAGPITDSPPDLMAIGAQRLVAAMRRHDVRRLVSVCGPGVVMPEDPPVPLALRLYQEAMELFLSRAMHDAQRHADLVRGSGLDWTIVRPTRLRTDEATGTTRTDLGAGGSLARADLARFVVEELTARRFVNQAPFVRS
jgi:putative NADH-flavin reductase